MKYWIVVSSFVLLLQNPAFSQHTARDPVFSTIDSLRSNLRDVKWKEGFRDTVADKWNPLFWYFRKDQQLGIFTDAIGCMPECLFYELPDSTLWMEICVAEHDIRSMPPPEKCWVYKIKDRKILFGTWEMKNMYREWNCNFELREKDLFSFIDKFYLYKSLIKD